MNIQVLPDKGQKLLKQIRELEEVLGALALAPEHGKLGHTSEFGGHLTFTRDIGEAVDEVC